MYPHFTFLAGSEQNECYLHVASVIRSSVQMLHFCISDATRIHLHYRLQLQQTKRGPSTFAMRPAIKFETSEVKKDMKNIIHKYVRLLTVQRSLTTNKATECPSDTQLTT